MPEYTWDDCKNERLKNERGISFEDVVYHIDHGGLLDDILHPNQERHPGQRWYIVLIEDYVYEVSFYREGDVESLRTAYPSRKFTRVYLG